MDLPDMLRIAEALNREGVDYILFGGGAVNIHGLVRATEDADFFVSPLPENVVRIKRALRSLWDDPDIDEIQDEEMSTGTYPSFRYGPPGVEYYLDFVSRLGEAFSYSDLEAEIHTVDGVPVRVATPRTLVRMKRDTVRHKDRQDADALRRKFGLEE